jgi:peptidoglycan hydrolase CwlO-like protein
LRVPRQAAAVSALLVGLLLVTATGAHADRIGAKRAQARAVLVDLQRLDAAAQRANSRYQEASQGLRRVERRLAVNRQALGVARSNLTRAQRALMKRLFAIYTSQEEQSSLAVILGARSLDDLISRIETVNSLSKQDSALINQVVSFQHQIVQRRMLLRQERVRQHRLVVVRASARKPDRGEARFRAAPSTARSSRSCSR